jgi:hypothetical protein
MAITTAPSGRPEAPLFADGLGERVITSDGATGELLQVLQLRPELTAVPSFEFALRERAARLANFRHASYARVRRIDRTISASAPLAVVSDHVEGTRLSELLRIAQEHRLPLDTNAALYLIQQLVPAVALLHDNARDAAHGLIGPERIVVTPQGRLVLVEHVLGAAIEQLQYGRDRLWQEFRVGMPATAGLPRFDHRSDIAGIGLIALSLLLGRNLARDEYPHHIAALLNEAPARIGGSVQPLAPGLRSWIARALQLEVRRAFGSTSEAAAALDEALASEPQYVAAPVALETFLSRYAAALLTPAPSTAMPPPVAAHPVAVPPPQAPVEVRPVEAAVPAPFAMPPAPPVYAQTPASAPVPSYVMPPPAQADPILTAAPLDALIDLSDLEIPSGTPSPSSSLPRPAPAPEPPPVVAAPVIEHAPLFNPDAPFTLPMPPPPPAKPGGRFSGRMRAAVAAIILLVGGGAVAARVYLNGGSGAPALGTLVVESNPSGVPVFVDGVDRGVTPARITLAPGSHTLELRRGVPRVIPFTLTEGGEVTQYLEFAETPQVGALTVQSEPAGARVFVDGVERGVAPITLTDMAPGEHDVRLQTEQATSRHQVVVQAGVMASLVVPFAPVASGPVSGWVSVKAPIRVEIHEGGRMLGTNETDRLMLAAGRHQLEFVNDALSYRVTRVIQVPAGRTAAVDLELPRGVLHVNAAPWAEVWLDGTRVGETPIGNLEVPIGPHELIFRHPQFGEKRHAVSVTLGGPVRVSVDMKQ